MIIEAAERETMQMNMAMERRLENDVAMLERTNNQIGETNSRVLPLLETLTGQTLGGDQELWRKWWTEQLGYVYDDRYSSKPTLTDSVAVPDLSVVAPSVFLAVQPHSACFAAGTLVHTHGRRAGKSSRSPLVTACLLTTRRRAYFHFSPCSPRIGTVRRRRCESHSATSRLWPPAFTGSGSPAKAGQWPAT